jgi:chemotaxis protein methyltransferase CheR
MDVVFLRNVLIYFDLETKRTILDHVRRLLQPWGFLFLGGAETTINLGDVFERVQYDKAGCYRLKSS